MTEFPQESQWVGAPNIARNREEILVLDGQIPMQVLRVGPSGMWIYFHATDWRTASEAKT